MQHVLSFTGTIEDAMSLSAELTSLMEDQTYEYIPTYHDFSCSVCGSCFNCSVEVFKTCKIDIIKWTLPISDVHHELITVR